MKVVLLCALLFAAPAFATNPLSKTIELLDSLAAKISAQGEAEAKAYKEYVEWCDDASSNLAYEIKTGTAKKEELGATISKATADIGASDDHIEELAGSISADERELKEASQVRAKEAADFAASEAELVDAIDTLDRAVMVLEKEMKKNPAALAQVNVASNMNSLLKSLSVVIDAAAFPVTDQRKLAALVQARQGGGDSEDDDDFGAPAAAVYKSHSSSIFDILEDMKEKAEGQLGDLRKAESSTKHNFQMLKQSLTDQVEADTKDSDEAKASKASSQETKATAEGDLAETVKDLENDKAALATAGQTCMSIAADHEATMKSRSEELAALAAAKKALTETSAGAVEQSYSFFQGALSSSSELTTRADLANAEIVHLIKKLAKENHSTMLAQLASRIAATIRYGTAAGQDPFAKVKSLIADMITKLEGDAKSETNEKAYCDEELAKTAEKKEELNADISKLTSKVDRAAAASAGLKADVTEIQAELAKLSKSQAEMDTIRRETHSEYTTAKADLELGIEGVRKALSVLRDYYGGSAAASASMIQSNNDFTAMMQQPAMPEQHSKSEGAGGSIIGMLEVVESDFAKDLATEETQEADAEAEYQKTTQINKVTKTIKEQDVKYKTKEFKGLDKTISELSSDKETTGTELAAVLEYDTKIKARCIAKPETYESRAARRG